MLLLIIGCLPPGLSLFLFFLLSVYYSACGLRAFAFFIKNERNECYKKVSLYVLRSF